MVIVEILALIVVFACLAFGLANCWFGIVSKSNGFEDRAKSEFLTAGIAFVMMIIIAVCLCVFSPNLKNSLGNWRDQSYVDSSNGNSGGVIDITHYYNCQCNECQTKKENTHDADCQCSTCKPHDEDCQCSKCVEKYCNSFNHGDDCECDKCLYCKEYGE